MGVVIPEDIKVLSTEFKDFVVELANELNRVSEAYTDLQRVRANTDSDQGGTSTPGTLLFYMVSFDGGSPVTTSLGDEGFNVPAVEYANGLVFQAIGESISIVAENVTGYDFGIIRNDPEQMPPQAEIVKGDFLSGATVVGCNLSNNIAYFSSVKPRLSVECRP